MQIMAIDYGSKRVGVASTDETGEFALPRVVLENNEELIDRLLKFISEHNIEQVVIGESKNFDGSPNLIQKDIDLLSSMLMSMLLSKSISFWIKFGEPSKFFDSPMTTCSILCSLINLSNLSISSSLFSSTTLGRANSPVSSVEATPTRLLP